MIGELSFAFGNTLDGRIQRWSGHIADHGPGHVVDTVAERRSLFNREYRILVVAADSPLVDPDMVEQLRARGRAVMAVWDPAAPRTKEMAVRLGADAILDADAGPEDFVRAALALAGEWEEPLGAEDDWQELAPAAAVATEELHRLSAPAGATGPVPPPPASRRGDAFRLVVCGPAGDEAAVVAVELARAASGGRRRVVLVDANELNPSVVQHLSLPVLPNLRIAVDAVRDRHHRLTDALLPVPAGEFWVLGGLADPGQWAEVTPAEVAAVVDELANGCEVVVVQAAPVAEDLGGYGGPARFGITRRLLADADRVVGVAVASPTGVAQLAAWLPDVRAAAPHAPVDVVMTRAPEDRFRRAELTERLSQDLAPASVTLLPADARVERAVWDGTLVRRGPFRRAVADLAAAIIPALPKRKGGRRG